MREIKFRIWIEEQMEIPLYIRLPITEGIPIMQYTGLRDKNGVEIYEGDVIKHVYSKNTICVIKFGEFMPDFFAQFCKDYEIEPQPLQGYYAEVISASYGVGQKLFLNKNIVVEIIGNIWEHPHLLAKEDKD